MVQRVKNPNQPGQPNIKLVKPHPKVYIQTNDVTNKLAFEDITVDIPSVVSELTHNFTEYHVERSCRTDWLYLSTYPPKIQTIIETIRYQVKFQRHPGVHPTVSCCIALGIEQLHVSSAINELSKLCSEFRRRKKVGSQIELFIEQYLRSSLECEADKGSELRIVVPQKLKDQVTQISDETGLTKSAISLMSMYACLIQQETTPEDFAVEWKDKLDRSLLLVECKLAGAKAIMSLLESGRM